MSWEEQSNCWTNVFVPNQKAMTIVSVADESMEAGSGEIESESSELGQTSPTELALE